MAPPKSVAHYDILGELGAGGMGVVYKACDRVLGRNVALKFVGIQSETAVKRFTREAKIISALDHPNICTVYGFERTEDGQHFLVMAYYEGETLARKIARGPLLLQEVLGIGMQVVDGLALAHSRGIIHRDIKPGNIMITQGNVVKILDFGLALATDETRLTMTEWRVGTFSYMSPEQISNGVVDARTDIFSLGLVLHEALTGVLPTASSDGILRLHPNIPTALSSILNRALHRNPDRRYQDVVNMGRALSELAVGAGCVYLRGGMTPAGKHRPSVAVMPFACASRNPEDEYFSEGLTDELITSLARLPQLRIVSRTSVFQFKGKSLDVRDIADKLHVDLLIEGSVRSAGERLRVSVQLTNAHSGYQVWSERYDRDLHDVFAIQDEIANAVASMLNVRLNVETGVPAPQARTEDVNAYHLYLKGRYYWHRQTPEALLKARDFFEQAIQADPRYVAAHAGVADCLSALGFWGVLPPEQVWPQARARAQLAISMDRGVASAHVAMGWVSIYGDWDWNAAGRELKQAVQLSPGDPTTHYAYAVFLTQIGQHDQSIAEFHNALELDPLSVSVNTALSFAYYYARRFDQALKQTEQTLELDPNSFESKIILGLIFAEKGRYDEAISTLKALHKAAGGVPMIMGLLGNVLGKAGRTEEAHSLRDQCESASGGGASVAKALISIGLGDHGRAFQELEAAVRNRDALICYLNVLPCYDPIRSDPRFAEIQKGVGLTDLTTSL